MATVQRRQQAKASATRKNALFQSTSEAGCSHE